MNCEHKDFGAMVNIHPIAQDEQEQKVAYYAIEVRFSCRDCGKPLEWVGLPVGLSAYRPSVSLDGLELRAPMVAQGEKVPDGLPSFTVTYRQTPEREPIKQ